MSFLSRWLRNEDSSEIASARVSSSYRKSLKRTIFQQKPEPTRNHSLSRISEENTDENSESEELRLKGKVNCCHVTFVCDDDKVTSDTYNTSNNHSSDKDKVSHDKESNKKEPVTVVSDKVICDKSDKEDNEDFDKKKSRIKKASENLKQRCLLSRFVPDFIDNNKIAIVCILFS